MGSKRAGLAPQSSKKIIINRIIKGAGYLDKGCSWNSDKGYPTARRQNYGARIHHKLLNLG